MKKYIQDFVPWYSRRIYVMLLLIGLPLLVYFKVIGLDFTMLDDSIFIKENREYNSNLSNLATSFKRGLFNPANDFYYRPVFLVDFILESRLFGISPAGYHFTNLLFHILCVVLLYLFFMKLKIPGIPALVLALIFAVHPVLSQAVAWIPGRNDMLLMIFFLTGILLTLKYIEKPSWFLLSGQFITFLIALFTKETAVIIPVVTLALVVVRAKGAGHRAQGTGHGAQGTGHGAQGIRHSSLVTLIKVMFPLIISWIFAIGIWIFVRSNATLLSQNFTISDLLQNGINRSQALVQYLGKIFFPFNLAVFPAIGHITLWWGIAALLLLAGMIVYSKSYLKPLTILGLAWFILFLIPVLVVPPSLNDQVFEHRLYIPIVGILLVLSQTKIFGGSQENEKPRTEKSGKNSKFKIQNSKFKMQGLFFTLLILFFSIVTFARINQFHDPVTFWTRAVEGNPGSAYARMMLGLRMTDTAEMKRNFAEAYRLNPDEKMLNYLMGKLALDDNRIAEAEMHLKKELKQSQLPDNYFNLARVFFLKNQFDSAAWSLENVVKLDPGNPQANHNLLLLYLQLGRKPEARTLLEAMKAKGLEIPPEAVEQVSREDDSVISK